MDGSPDSLLADVAAPRQARADTLVDPLLGTRLGNYEIIFVLGKGAYGTVYKARDVKLGRFVAIKFLHEFLDARHEAMFLREAKAIAALEKHPSIVQIFEWSEYQGRDYFVLEFVGSNAAMLLRVNPSGLAPARAAGIALDCAEALAYAHRQGIIHRDIKPANLLLEIEGGRAKLADFGVARLFDPGSGAQNDTPGGTPGYMAPEIIRGEEGDARSDLFSLGVTLYELLCGKRPFEGRDIGEVALRTREGEAIPLRERTAQLPEALYRFVARAMAHEPADRYPDAAVLATDLRAFLKGPSAPPARDAASEDQAREAKTRAFKAAEDATHAGADKLAHDLLREGIEAFRDGEAYERLRQSGPAAERYEAALGRFLRAEECANQIMTEIRELKAAQHAMAGVRNEAEAADAAELAAAQYADARAEEDAARKTAGLTEATKRYRKAQGLYDTALAEARRQGAATLHEPRKQLEAVRRRAAMMQAEVYASEETAAAEALARSVEEAVPDYRAAARFCHAAINRYNEALRVAIERKRLASEKEAREPISVAGMELVWIPPGEFSMGDDQGSEEERPAHTVQISRGFWLGKYPVTQTQWRNLMGSDPSGFQGADGLPVENISWEEVQAFLAKLNEAGQGVFRLPSEAEWEYACRAGSTARWFFGDAPDELGSCAWSPENAAGRTHPVGEKRPNAWGLHDMAGNVGEWCEDRWHPNYTGAPGDGSPWTEGETDDHVIRGGSWCVLTPECTSTARSWYAASGSRMDFVGFRVVRNK